VNIFTLSVATVFKVSKSFITINRVKKDNAWISQHDCTHLTVANTTRQTTYNSTWATSTQQEF